MKSSLLFWFWNDELDAGMIRRQIDDMHRQNVEGFFIHVMPEEFRPHDFVGGMPGYLSERYFEMFAVALERCKELGMELWLYDEGGWPSGSCNGSIPEKYPELRMHRIESSGEIVEFPNRPDLLNPRAVQLFLDMVYEQYKKRFGAEFGKTVPGIFTDEPFFGTFLEKQMLPWSPILAAEFAKVKNYDARDCAMKILRDNDPVARQDYFEIWNKLICTNFMEPVQKWCHDNNLLFTGHFNGDDTTENMIKLLGSDPFTLHKYFDIPGCDVIWRQIHPLKPETDFPRLAVAAAGKKPVISETFAVYGADMPLAEMKYTAAMQFVAGVNTVAPMAAHYSNRGGRQVSTVSNFFASDPRWEFYHHLSGFLRRMQAVLNRATPVYKAAVHYPAAELQRGTYTGDLFAEGLKFAARQITYTYTPDAGFDSGKCDIATTEPCPALRTRHLFSPRGERRIFVNSGLEKISCTFTAPSGYNVWFDPATGKRSRAVPADGKLTLTLPFAGVMVLLTLPGKSAVSAAETVEAVKIPLHWEYSGIVKSFRATENGLTADDIPVDRGEIFCGTRRYTAHITVPQAATAAVVLPEAVRAMSTLLVNSNFAGHRVWAPYKWEISLKPGENILTLDLATTPAPAVYAPEHVAMLEKNGFANGYFKKCLEFPVLFPDENPLADAFVELY